MKFKVTMKDPDALLDPIAEALERETFTGLSDEEATAVRASREERIAAMCQMKWFKYGEYLTVEIDTEAQTCTVVEVGK